MLALLAIDVLPSEEPSGTGTGPILAGPDQTVLVRSGRGGGANLPVQAPTWTRELDPSDKAPFAYDWSPLLKADEQVVEILSVTMLALGASLGVRIDDDGARLPIIDETAGRKTQIWLKVDDSQKANPAFLGQGALVGVAMLVRTSSTPSAEYEATAIVKVRQE